MLLLHNIFTKIKYIPLSSWTLTWILFLALTFRLSELAFRKYSYVSLFRTKFVNFAKIYPCEFQSDLGNISLGISNDSHFE